MIALLAGLAPAASVDVVAEVPALRTRAVSVSTRSGPPGSPPSAISDGNLSFMLPIGARVRVAAFTTDRTWSGPSFGVSSWSGWWGGEDAGLSAVVVEPWAGWTLHVERLEADGAGYFEVVGGAQVGVMRPARPFASVVAPAVRAEVGAGHRFASGWLFEGRVTAVPRLDVYKGELNHSGGLTEFTYHPGGVQCALGLGRRL